MVWQSSAVGATSVDNGGPTVRGESKKLRCDKNAEIHAINEVISCNFLLLIFEVLVDYIFGIYRQNLLIYGQKIPGFDAVFTTVFINVVIATSTPPQGCLLSFLPFSHFN
jgi:hypothetical protein